MTPIETHEFEHFLLRLSVDAGDYLRSHFHSFRNIYKKDFKDLASNVDLNVERLIIDRIQSHFPKHGIVSEETGTINDQSDYQWIIDPIDGSSHFVRNIPIYAINIALTYRGETIAAAVNHPTTQQIFFAAKGRGARLNGLPIQVSNTQHLADAYVFVELPEQKFSDQPSIEKDFAARMKIFENLVRRSTQVEMYRIGGFGQCLLAAGAFDAYIDLSGSTRNWDQIGSLFIAQEAGATIIDLEPRTDTTMRVMVTNGKLDDELRSIITS